MGKSRRAAKYDFAIWRVAAPALMLLADVFQLATHSLYQFTRPTDGNAYLLDLGGVASEFFFNIYYKYSNITHGVGECRAVRLV